MSQIQGLGGGGTGGVTTTISPYIVGPTNSDFTTIQAAITAAVGAGASSSTPANIYVKPGTYNENLTVADGVYIMGLDDSSDLLYPNALSTGVADNLPAVIVTGTITGPAAANSVSKLCNIHFIVGGVALVTTSGNFTNDFTFNACRLTLGNGSTTGKLWTCSSGASNAANLIFNRTFVEGLSTSVISNATAGVLTLFIQQSSLFKFAASTTYNRAINVLLDYSLWDASGTFNTLFSFTGNHSKVTGTLSSSYVTAGFTANFCDLSELVLTLSGVGAGVTLYDCVYASSVLSITNISILRNGVDVAHSTGSAATGPCNGPEYLPIKDTSAANYVVTPSDYFIGVQTTQFVANTVTLPLEDPTHNPGRVLVIKDVDGGAAGNPITIDPGIYAIDGTVGTISISTNFGYVMLLFCAPSDIGPNWAIISRA